MPTCIPSWVPCFIIVCLFLLPKSTHWISNTFSLRKQGFLIIAFSKLTSMVDPILVPPWLHFWSNNPQHIHLKIDPKTDQKHWFGDRFVEHLGSILGTKLGPSCGLYQQKQKKRTNEVEVLRVLSLFSFHIDHFLHGVFFFVLIRTWSLADLMFLLVFFVISYVLIYFICVCEMIRLYMFSTYQYAFPPPASS